MNSVHLIGRITKDVELKHTTSGIPVAQFTVAINAKSKDGDYTEFIDCVVWREFANTISKYLTKGKLIAIEGSLHKRSYEDKKKTKHYVTEVNVSKIELLEKKSFSNAEMPSELEDVADIDDDGIPI